MARIHEATAGEAGQADLVGWSVPTFQQFQQCRDQSLSPHGFLGVERQLLPLPLMSNEIVLQILLYLLQLQEVEFGLISNLIQLLPKLIHHPTIGRGNMLLVHGRVFHCNRAKLP
jgi:hypothetical protein